MFRFTLLATSALCAWGSLAQAQELNYADYEMLFEEPITLGATGTPKRASETPANMTIITADEIRRSGARDVIEILRRVTGVDVQRTENSSATIGIRGMNVDSGRLRVLINGRDTFRNYEGVTIWAALPVNMEDIRQIEVVRGPSTALYGANAVTGVINIVTHNPLFEDNNYASARIGLEDQYEGNLGFNLNFPNEKGSIHFSYGRGELDHFDSAALTRIEREAQDDPDYTRALIDAALQVNDVLAVGLSASLFEGPSRLQTFTGENAFTQVEDKTYGGYASVKTDASVWRLSFHYNDQTETRNTVISVPSGGQFVLPNSVSAESTNVMLSRVSKPRSDLGLRFSAGYQFDTVPQFGLSPADNTGDISYTTWFASGLADYDVSRNVNVMTSARMDYVQPRRTALEADFLAFSNDDYEDYTALSFNLALIWTPDADNVYRFTLGRGFNAPNLFNLGGQLIDSRALVPGVTSNVGGHPGIDPEFSRQFEASWHRKLARINGEFSLTGFIRQDTDIIYRLAVLRPTANGLFDVGSANIGDADTLGFEAELKGQTQQNLSWRLNYAYSDTEDDLLSNPGGLPLSSDVARFTAVFYDNRSSQHIVTAQGTWIKDKLWVDSLVQFKSGYDSFFGALDLPFAPSAASVDDVILTNLTLGYELNDKIDVTLTGENIFDSLHQESVDPTTSADRRVWATLNYRF